MLSAGVDCRFQFWGYTSRTQADDGEVLITMNERHFDTNRIASTFTGWRKANMVVHRKNGSNLTNWPLVPYNAGSGEIDLQGVLTHEFGHCYWLEHSGDGNDTMFPSYGYQRARFGPWEGDVARVKALYQDMDRNRLREFRSADGGNSWVPLPNQLTSYNHYHARTCLTAGISPIGASGLYALAWSHPNRIPTWLRTDSVNFLFAGWVYYGGERSVHGPALADEPGGTLLWAWVDNSNDGALRVVRSTDQGGSWHWVNSPAGAQSYGIPGLASTVVNGQRAWILAWAHFDRNDATNTGYVRASISFDAGITWSNPTYVSTFYKTLGGVAAAATEDNRVMLGFSWAGSSLSTMNLIRTLNCAVVGNQLTQQSVGFSIDRARVQPALAYDVRRNRFVLCFREQNFLTSLRVATRAWGDVIWPAAQQLGSSTSNTGPALATGRAVDELLLWYASE